jgi:beta-glucanase (GH16 family)
MKKKLSRILAITLAAVVMTTMNGNWFVTHAKAKSTEKETVSEEYSLLWCDDFTGKTLDTTKWNYELHDPGWVNNELQSYTNSSKNTYVKDGNLVIQPIKTVDEATGNVSYTSGRINTQNKVDFKYGKVEVRAKLPIGQGIWPAIWMMPTDDNLYDGWPKCGEIDIMELLGHNTSKVYQTLHYGKNSTDVQSQGTKTLTNGDFSSDYHVFSVEWDPDKISFFVDGELTKTIAKWYTGTEGVGIITYPAPFDQNFYVILNIAVGGNWPGNPDTTTDFTKAKMLVDYVKIYQKASYDENVTMPETSVTLRDPDANGNYIKNSDFSEEEVLDDTAGWFLQTMNGGDAAAAIADHTMTITTKNEGTVDYAIQAMQAGIPLAKGGQYRITFDAKAEADRSVVLRLDGPDYNYLKYMEDQTANLTTTYKTYTYDITMSADTDENGRMEFNLGAQNSKNPTATVQIKNVKFIKTGQSDVSKDNSKEVKTVLTDGNYVYNGTFDQGTNRFGYWEVSSNKVKASVTVTNSNYVRMLKVKVPSSSKKQDDVIVSQKELALKADTTYVLSFDAKAAKAKTLQVTIAGKTYKADLTTKTKQYKFEFTTAANLKANRALLKFLLGKKGTIYIDNVRIDKVQSAGSEMIQNGDFADGITNWAPYIDAGASATYVVENKEIKYDIKDAGSQNWHVQLKQSGLNFEKGKTYQIKATFKSSADRKVELALMGNASKNYAYYGGEVITLAAGKEYNYVDTFTMNSDSDPNGDIVLSLGKVGDGTTPAGSVELTSVSVVIVK